jgi:hypothetical protein
VDPGDVNVALIIVVDVMEPIEEVTPLMAWDRPTPNITMPSRMRIIGKVLRMPQACHRDDPDGSLQDATTTARGGLPSDT